VGRAENSAVSLCAMSVLIKLY